MASESPVKRTRPDGSADAGDEIVQPALLERVEGL